MYVYLLNESQQNAEERERSIEVREPFFSILSLQKLIDTLVGDVNGSV